MVYGLGSVYCSQRDCDINAQCSVQGSTIRCACKPEYEGDGKICIPRNPCSQDNGACPTNSTVCVFRGPNNVSCSGPELKPEMEPEPEPELVCNVFFCPLLSQSTCECMSGMSPVGSSAASGCQLLSACSPETCHSSAVCQTKMDGNPRSD